MSMWRRALRTVSAFHGRTSNRRRRPCRGPFLPVAAEVLEDRSLLSTISLNPIYVNTELDVVDPNDGLTSLREAITQANASAENDEIILQGVRYQLSLAGAGDDANLSGDLDILSYRGTLRIVGAPGTIIDGNGLDRVLHVVFGGVATVELQGVTITGGVSQDDGGGIRSDHFGALWLTDSVIRNNHSSGNGGGLAVFRSNHVRIAGSTIENNSAGGGGGGIWCRVSLAQRRERLTPPPGAEPGEGIVWIEPVFAMGGSTIASNHAWGDGGGLHLHLYVGASVIGYSYVGGETTFIENSAAGRGGGLFIDGSAPTNFGDVRIVENHAGEAGGGIFINTQGPVRPPSFWENLVLADNSPDDFATASDEPSQSEAAPAQGARTPGVQAAPAGTESSPSLVLLVAEVDIPVLPAAAFGLGTSQETSELQATTVGTLLSPEPGVQAAEDPSADAGPRSETSAGTSRRGPSNNPATNEIDRLFEDEGIFDLLLTSSLGPLVD